MMKVYKKVKLLENIWLGQDIGIEQFKNLKHYTPQTEENLKPVFMNYKDGFIINALAIARFEQRIGAKIFEEGDLYLEK